MAKEKLTSIQNNSELVTEELKRKIQLALNAIGSECETYAKKECPVDTGRLRNSLTYATASRNSFVHAYTDDNGKYYNYRVGDVVDDDCVYIGSNVEYAAAVEYRKAKHNVGRAHFLRDAAATHGKHYKEIAKAILES